MGVHVTLCGFWITFVVLLFACSPDNTWQPDGGGGDGGIDSGPTPENNSTACADGRDNDGDGQRDCDDSDCSIVPFCSTSQDSGPDGTTDTGPCSSVSVSAESTSAPADIIWVIDSSGSMRQEATAVQNNINDFAADIFSSGVDYHVVVMTDPTFVSVPAPLGVDTAHYLFVNRPITSNAPLQELLDQYGHYSGFLRASAVTHIVVVTDDNSELPAADFQEAMEDRLGKTFTFHAIASEDAYHDCALGICDPGCSGENGDASDIGAEYYALADATGGEQFSICTSDWSGLFATLRDVVVVSAALPCFYEIPTPPDGMAFNSSLVNVVYTDDSGADHTFARAMDPARCESEVAWYYDNNDTPTRIELCSAACDLVSASTVGGVNVAFGCEPDIIIY